VLCGSVGSCIVLLAALEGGTKLGSRIGRGGTRLKSGQGGTEVAACVGSTGGGGGGCMAPVLVGEAALTGWQEAALKVTGAWG